MAYRLELPQSLHVQPIFHVSYLKKIINGKNPIKTTLLEPKAILQTQIKQLQGTSSNGRTCQ
jgi:hypothetical protein